MISSIIGVFLALLLQSGPRLPSAARRAQLTAKRKWRRRWRQRISSHHRAAKWQCGRVTLASGVRESGHGGGLFIILHSVEFLTYSLIPACISANPRLELSS